MNKTQINNVIALKGVSAKRKVSTLEKILLGGKFYTYTQQGSGRYTKIVEDVENNLVWTLAKKLNFKLKFENEAPKGGKLGEYFKINLTASERRKTLDLIEFIGDISW